MPIFVGGIVRRMADARRANDARTAESDAGVLAASGMIAGEGLAGVAIAFLVSATLKWPESGFAGALKAVHFAAKDYTILTGMPAALGGVVITLAICTLVYRAARA
jgi:hypothetical protein